MSRLPEGWSKEPLKNILATLKDGTHFSPKSTDGPYKYITSKNIKFGKMDFSKISYISEEEHKQIFKSSPVYYGDVLLTKDGANTGNVAINILKEEFSLLSSVAILRGEKGLLDNSYLLQVLLSPIGQATLKSEMTGQAITRLTLNKIGNLTFNFPSLPEQQKIAQILSTWDKAITSTEKLIANSQQQKKTLMQQLLTGKKRFPEFKYPLKKLAVSKFGTVITGNTPPKLNQNNYGGHISWVTAEDLKRKYVKNSIIKLTEEGANKARLVPKGSVLVTCIASIGKNAIADEQLSTNQQINAVIINKNHSNEFFYYMIEFQKNKLLAYAGTTAVPILNKTNFEKINFLAPIFIEQRKIALILATLDKKISTLQTQLQKLKLEKKALMQQLLTGKRRVSFSKTAA